MNNYQYSDSSFQQGSENKKLAQWLQHVLTPFSQEQTTLTSSVEDSTESDFLLTNDYHPGFYQQLPDFIMALLHNDPLATIRYAPLLYHLAACSVCHTAYLELYDAMRYAVETTDVYATIDQGIRPLATIPANTLVKLCQLLIKQGEAVLRQARHDHVDNDVLARSLLQLAMRVSTQIMQTELRSRALHDLVRIATLFDGPHSPGEHLPATHAYSPLIGAGSTSRHGKRSVKRGVNAAVRAAGKSADHATIYLQSHEGEGTITQHEDILELHLQDLDKTLYGHYLNISVPLGSLLEPVRWIGGNPRAIPTAAPVDANGTIQTPLGYTDLRLTQPDDRNLLEVMFLRLEVRPIN